MYILRKTFYKYSKDERTKIILALNNEQMQEAKQIYYGRYEVKSQEWEKLEGNQRQDCPMKSIVYKKKRLVSLSNIN